MPSDEPPHPERTLPTTICLSKEFPDITDKYGSFEDLRVCHDRDNHSASLFFPIHLCVDSDLLLLFPCFCFCILLFPKRAQGRPFGPTKPFEAAGYRPKAARSKEDVPYSAHGGTCPLDLWEYT